MAPPSPSPSSSSSPDAVAVNRAMVAVDASLARTCAAVAPDAVALVDAWGFTDAQLGHSAIGAADGDVYQRLFEYAQREPLNQPESPPSTGATTTAEEGAGGLGVAQHKASIRRLTQRWEGRGGSLGGLGSSDDERAAPAGASQSENNNAGPPGAPPTPVPPMSAVSSRSRL